MFEPRWISVIPLIKTTIWKWQRTLLLCKKYSRCFSFTSLLNRVGKWMKSDLNVKTVVSYTILIALGRNAAAINVSWIITACQIQCTAHPLCQSTSVTAESQNVLIMCESNSVQWWTSCIPRHQISFLLPSTVCTVNPPPHMEQNIHALKAPQFLFTTPITQCCILTTLPSSGSGWYIPCKLPTWPESILILFTLTLKMVAEVNCW